MFTRKTILLTSLSALALGACTQSKVDEIVSTLEPLPNVAIGAEEEATRKFSDEEGDAGNVVGSGGTLTARQVGAVAMSLNYNTGDTGPIAAANSGFAVRQNESGALTMTVDGVDYAFVPGQGWVDEEDGETYGYEKNGDEDDIWYSLWSQSGPITELADSGNGWHKVVNYQTNTLAGGPWNQQGFAVVGTETLDAALDTLPTAHYRGDARFNIAPVTGWVDGGTSRTRINGGVSMTADFAGGTISGNIDNLSVRAPGTNWDDREAIGGAIAMNPASFDVNGFQGHLVPNDVLKAEGIEMEATYSGAFYGPEANEVAGTMSGTGSLDGTDYNSIGYFKGWKQD